jgi:hypothetical protein
VWLWLPLVAALVALAIRARRSPDGATWGWRMLALSWLLAGPLLVLRFDVEPVAYARYVIERFHLMPALLLVVPAAIAVDWIVVQLERTKPVQPVVVTGIAVVTHLALAFVALPRLAQQRSPALERTMENLLTSMPANAVVLANGGDPPHNVVTYLQLARGVRPDVTVVKWRLVTADWYRARLVPRGLTFEASDKPSLDIVAKLVAAGRPVFVDLEMGNVLDKYQTYPFGIVFRVVPPTESRPSIQQVFALNKKFLENARIDYPTPGPDDAFATIYHRQYVLAWTVIGKALALEKDPDAAWAFAAAETLAPK